MARKEATIDVNSDEVKNFIQKMKDKNITIDPTITVFESMFTDMPGKIAKAYLPIENIYHPKQKEKHMSGSFIDDESLARAIQQII